MFFTIILFTALLNNVLLDKLVNYPAELLIANLGMVLPFVNIIVENTTSGAASDIDGYYSILKSSSRIFTPLKFPQLVIKVKQYENVKISIDLTTKIDLEFI